MSPPTCMRCGAPITADASFCGQCGAGLAGSEVPSAPPPPPSSVAQTTPSRVPARRQSFPIWPLLILVVGVLAVVAAVLLRPRREPPAGEALLGAGSPPPAQAGDGWRPSPTQPASVVAGLGVVPSPVGAGGSPDLPPPLPELVPTEPPPPTPTPTPPLVAVFKARKAARFDVSPDDAEITVNGRSVGKADDWDDRGGGKLYEFDAPGAYYVRLSLKGYRTAWIKIVVSRDASEKVAEVDTELKKDGDTGDKKADSKKKSAKKSQDGDEDDDGT